MRLWLETTRLFPKSRLAFVALYLMGLDVLLFAMEKIAGRIRSSYGNYLSGWVVFLSIIVLGLLCVLGARWISSGLLWRLRNRLIVTYIFIGVVPLILLVSLAGLAFYLFSGQFAAYILTSKLDSERRSLRTTNLVIAGEIAADLDARREVRILNDSARNPQRNSDVAAWLDGKLLIDTSIPKIAPALSAYINDGHTRMVRDHDRIFLRSIVSLATKSGDLTVVSSRPLDQRLLNELAADLGEITLFRSDTAAGEPIPIYSEGAIPPPRRTMDMEVRFGTDLPVITWTDGHSANPALMSVQTRFSKLYDYAFSSLGDIAPTIEFVLFLLLIVLGFFEVAAWYVGTRLTRSVTGAVAQLYLATTHINRGDFSHRIPIASNDQIAALAGSFNLMTASIEKLILEQKEKQRLENEITIAQEVQAQLFPQHITQLPSLEVYGFCRPARRVSGDYYDFLPLGAERLVLAVGDVSGKGISAALLMATIHSAVRAYSLEGTPMFRQAEAVAAGHATTSIYGRNIPGGEASPGLLLSLLNHQLYHSTPMEKYATLFLAAYDGAERRLTFSNAGHLPPMLLGENGSIRRFEKGGTVVGLFDDIHYDEGSVQMREGDIFLAYSDGVTEPENDFGEFGEERLIELVQENRNLPLNRIAEIVTTAVDDWIAGAEQPDDITLVLARAR